MTDVTGTIQDLYSQGDILGRVVTFLEAMGIDTEHTSYEDLQVCDQMHARGIDATREHAVLAEIRWGNPAVHPKGRPALAPGRPMPVLGGLHHQYFRA
jgi:hypothetical protein